MHHLRLFPVLIAAALGAALPARAAELGEPVVKSHIGQQLVADIELLPDEGGAVRAAIAHDDVFSGANIARSPVIDTLHMSVMRRDGRQYLHITSIKPVNAEYLHLYLELVENGKRKIRPATLWLQPEPVVPIRPPAPAPAPVAVAARAPAPEPARPKPAPLQPKRSQPDVACQALDYTNAQLSAQIVDLEEKVKALQYAVDMQGTSAPVVAKKAVTPQRTARATVPARPARQDGAPMWPAFAGAGVLALGLGGGAWWWRRTRRVRAAAADEQPAET